MKRPKQAFRVLLTALSILVVICLLAIATGWFYVFQMSKQVSVLSTEILNNRRESSKLSELSISYQKVLAQKNVVFGAIPTTKDESTFMADVEAAAKANGLSINNTNVGGSQAKAQKSGAFSQTVKNPEYYELTIRYEVNGQYANFTKFLSDLSALRRLNSVADVAVTADLSEKTNVGKVKATFNVTIYTKDK